MRRAPLLFDASVYIPYLRGEAYAEWIEDATRTGLARLSAIVLAELYAGTRSVRDKADLDVARRAHEARDRLVTPDASDWCRAGQAIRRHGRLHGTIEPSDHWNDLLILLSAARVGARVVTENARHFARWASVLRTMGISARIEHAQRAEHLDD